MAVLQLASFIGCPPSEIKKMPWIEFTMYLDYMSYLMRWQSEDGAKKNKLLDRTDELKYGGEDVGIDFKKVKNQLRTMKQ